MNTSKSSIPDNQPIVFYDGGCPLCKKEISHYKKIDKAEALLWIDITKETDLLDKFGISYHSAMERLHCIDNNIPVTGAHAFILIWRNLPYYRYLASAVTFLKVISFLDWIYNRFATWRFKRRCKTSFTRLKVL